MQPIHSIALKADQPVTKPFAYLSIVEANTNGLFVVDNRWNVLHWNKGAETMLGITHSAIIGKNLWQQFAHLLPVEFYAVYEKAFTGDVPKHFQEYWAELNTWFDVITWSSGKTLSVSFKSIRPPLPKNSEPSQQQLIKLQELYKFVTEITHDCLWEWDVATKEVFWIDGGHKRIFGYPIENRSIPQAFWESCIHPEDRSRVLDNLKKILATGSEEKWEVEYRYKKADGDYLFVHDRGHIVYNEKNKAIRMVGATQDINQRIMLENQLIQQRTEQQRSITGAILNAQEVERAEIGRELHDNLGQILAVTKMYLQMGLSHPQWTENSIEKSINFITDTINEIRKISKKLIIPPRNIIGLVDNVLILIEDIAAVHPIKIKLDYADLAENEISDELEIGIFRIIQEQLNNVLKHAEATTVNISLKIIGPIVKLTIADDGKGHNNKGPKSGVGLSNVQSRADQFHGKVEIHTNPGQGFELVVSLPVKVPVPGIEHFYTRVPEVMSIDPTALTAAMLHEIRNPITNINLAAEKLKLNLADDTQKSLLSIIQRAVKKVNHLITDLVTQRQPTHYNVKRYSLHELINEVLWMANDRLLLKKIAVTRNYDLTDGFKMDDRDGMRVALTNIIINAVDAMSEEGILIITTRTDGEKFNIQIKDNGCGIPKEHLTEVFKPYFTSKEHGLGIGLSATSDILKANKVSVAVDSILNEGTSFSLSFQNEATPSSQQ